MTNKEISASIKEQYTRAVAKNPKAARFYAKLRDGTAKMADVLEYSGVAADTLTAIMGAEFKKQFPTGIPPDAITEIVPDDLRKNCTDVLDASRITITNKNRKAGIGIQGQELEPDSERIDGLTKHIAENLTDGELPADAGAMIRNLANSEVDRSIRENVRFLDRSGVTTTVSRQYTGKGLKDGPCQWCIDRQGDHVPVKEAQSRGMFERHTGCGCTIDYETDKGTQRQADWTKDAWKDQPETLEERRHIGL